MRLRYVPADPAGNLTALALTPVEPGERARVAAALMRLTGDEQVGFVDEASLFGPLPRLDMMGGEFCGNAARAFALYAAGRRGLGEKTLCVSVSGARAPVRVTLGPGADEAAADMPPPHTLETVEALGMRVPVVRMEGIAHAVLTGVEPSPGAADAVLAAMPPEDARGVLFFAPGADGKSGRMTPLVHVPATGTRVWEKSCGSGSVALAWLLSRALPDGEHDFAFAEPGGALFVHAAVRAGRAGALRMGGRVTLGQEREVMLWSC